jgi:hypothetical protein
VGIPATTLYQPGKIGVFGLDSAQTPPETSALGLSGVPESLPELIDFDIEHG